MYSKNVSLSKQRVLKKDMKIGRLTPAISPFPVLIKSKVKGFALSYLGI